MTSRSAPIAAVVTAFSRPAVTVATLRVIERCDPPPAEILVHVDAGQTECAAAVAAACPAARVIVSAGQVGPGGGRNRLVAAATQDLVASFDDDSYPMDTDYFARVVRLFEAFPGADVVGARVFQRTDAIVPAAAAAQWVADFEGGGAAYRRTAFERTGGYLPLPLAYSMEEADLAVRMHAAGGRVLRSPWLRVYHDADLARHADPRVTAASIRNIALLAFLRYPTPYWIVGAAQCLNRIQWLLRNGRHRGVISGLVGIPRQLRQHSARRRPLPGAAIRSYLRLRRHPVAADADAAIAWQAGS
jgi:GT2 family glycosyltransferase